MTTSVVTIFYVCLLPHVYSASLGWTVFHLIFGHWLLVNIVFHYTMGVFTHPGTPPAQVRECFTNLDTGNWLTYSSITPWVSSLVQEHLLPRLDSVSPDIWSLVAGQHSVSLHHGCLHSSRNTSCPGKRVFH